MITFDCIGLALFLLCWAFGHLRLIAWCGLIHITPCTIVHMMMRGQVEGNTALEGYHNM
jgi:hypothetical protein